MHVDLSDAILASEQDLLELSQALEQYHRMFEGDPTNLDEIKRARYQEQVVRHTENLLEIQALAYVLWVKNNRDPLPDDVGQTVIQWTDTRRV